MAEVAEVISIPSEQGKLPEVERDFPPKAAVFLPGKAVWVRTEDVRNCHSQCEWSADRGAGTCFLPCAAAQGFFVGIF